MKWRPGRLALCELLVLVLLLVVAHLAAGENGTNGYRGSPGASAASVATSKNVTRGVPSPAARCPAAQHAISHYRRKYTRSRAQMGLAGAPPRAWYQCDAARRRATDWRERAWKAKRAYADWKRDNYHWWLFMPRGSKAYRVASCETGYGRDPNFAHDSGTYVSAFGIYRAGYADDAHRVGNLSWDETLRRLGRLPTPLEQFQAMESHRAAHGGWSGWGCRGA